MTEQYRQDELTKAKAELAKARGLWNECWAARVAELAEAEAEMVDEAAREYEAEAARLAESADGGTDELPW